MVLVFGVPATGYAWLSERNAGQQADELAEELRRAGRQVDDVAGLSGDEVGSDGGDAAAERPLVEALGHGDALVGYAASDSGISVVYETSWGLARRCVHLLLRDGSPVRTAVTDSATCRPLGIG